MSNPYLKKNISLLRYLIGLWLLGSVAWMPFYYGVKEYFMLSQVAKVWMVGLLFIFASVFSGATLIAFLGAIFPYKGWSFDKKFYRFFLIIALILVPITAAYMADYSPIEISELLSKNK